MGGALSTTTTMRERGRGGRLAARAARLESFVGNAQKTLSSATLWVSLIVIGRLLFEAFVMESGGRPTPATHHSDASLQIGAAGVCVALYALLELALDVHAPHVVSAREHETTTTTTGGDSSADPSSASTRLFNSVHSNHRHRLNDDDDDDDDDGDEKEARDGGCVRVRPSVVVSFVVVSQAAYYALWLVDPRDAFHPGWHGRSSTNHQAFIYRTHLFFHYLGWPTIITSSACLTDRLLFRRSSALLEVPSLHQSHPRVFMYSTSVLSGASFKSSD